MKIYSLFKSLHITLDSYTFRKESSAEINLNACCFGKDIIGFISGLSMPLSYQSHINKG